MKRLEALGGVTDAEGRKPALDSHENLGKRWRCVNLLLRDARQLGTKRRQHRIELGPTERAEFAHDLTGPTVNHHLATRAKNANENKGVMAVRCCVGLRT